MSCPSFHVLRNPLAVQQRQVHYPRQFIDKLEI
jgi:hypothetical protein